MPRVQLGPRVQQVQLELTLTNLPECNKYINDNGGDFLFPTDHQYNTDDMSKRSTRSVEKIVAVSGGFDPVHVGHIRMFEAARKLGCRLVVIINNDNWLKKKKGYVFMPEHERIEVLKGFRAVDEVLLTLHEEDPVDMSVCTELRALKPNIFANGGDRVHKNTPEVSVCREIGTEIIFGVGHGGKIQSSSQLVDKLTKSKVKKKLR